MKFIIYEQITPQIARLTVNRPEMRNALNWQAMEEFSQVIRRLKTDEEVRVLLIGGAGKAFISGADLGLVSSLDTKEDGKRLAVEMGKTLAEMRNLPILTIAMIDGHARGGGAEIAVACDFRFISDQATIGFVHSSLGLIPGWGGAHRLFDLVGYSNGLEYISSAKAIDAEEALRVGLVNAVFPEDAFEQKVLAFSNQVTENSWMAIKATKELFLSWEQAGHTERGFAERARFMELWSQDERRERFDKIRKNE
ncbi:MAG: enoyl-CoA hydratase/isomerase family protein [Chloroflexota bacterium]